MAFKSYTTCVQAGDYEDLDMTLEEVGAASALLAGGAASVLAISFAVSALEKACNYMLHGKLVCLGGDRCAVGTLVQFETTSEKSFPDDIDNDFSMNLMLWPFFLEDFVDETDFSKAYGRVTSDPDQGALVTERPGMPKPHEADDGSRYDPYKADVDIVDAYAIGGFNTMVPLTHSIKVPVLHCECEGSRIHDILQTLEDIGGFGTGICGWKPLGIPIGKVVCTIVQTLLAPIVLAALTIAWFAADEGNADDARTDPEAGELKLGNIVVITGRWVYDAGHTGWNEFHPVKTIQKISESPFGPEPGADLFKRWCTLTSEVPPPDRDGPGEQPASMTPGQQDTWDAQQRAEHRWVLHPAVDGCRGSEEPEPPIIR
jgi:hypothetical protein